MSICPRPRPTGPTAPPGRRLRAGLGVSRSIPVKSERMELGFPVGVTLVLGSSTVEPSERQIGNVGSK